MKPLEDVGFTEVAASSFFSSIGLVLIIGLKKTLYYQIYKILKSSDQIIYLKLNIFSKGNLILVSESSSDNFTGAGGTNTDVLSTGLGVCSVVEVIDDEDDEDNSALGRKTMTVLPTVVTNSSNPKTVLVVTPVNCHNQSRQLLI